MHKKEHSQRCDSYIEFNYDITEATHLFIQLVVCSVRNSLHLHEMTFHIFCANFQ